MHKEMHCIKFSCDVDMEQWSMLAWNRGETLVVQVRTSAQVPVSEF